MTNMYRFLMILNTILQHFSSFFSAKIKEKFILIIEVLIKIHQNMHPLLNVTKDSHFMPVEGSRNVTLSFSVFSQNVMVGIII